MSALPAAAAFMIWAPQAWRAAPVATDPAAHAGSLLRDRLAWQVTLFMGLQSALAYIVMGWLAPILRERGIDSATAGYLVAASILTQLVTSLFTPPLAARLRCPYARVRRADLWRGRWSGYDLVYLFQRPESMPRALAKACAEMARGSWVVSLEFEAAGWQPQQVPLFFIPARIF